MKQLTVTCDICNTICRPGEHISTYLFITLSINQNKQLQPTPKEENYCAACSTKIISAIEKIKTPSPLVDGKA